MGNNDPTGLFPLVASSSVQTFLILVRKIDLPHREIFLYNGKV
jgi:hypothetical protein